MNRNYLWNTDKGRFGAETRFLMNMLRTEMKLDFYRLRRQLDVHNSLADKLEQLIDHIILEGRDVPIIKIDEQGNAIQKEV